MSAENVEIVKRAYGALAEGDIAAAVALADPEIEMYSIFGGAEGRVYEGHDGVREYYADMADAWGKVIREPDDFLDAGDHVVVTLSLTVEGRGSGLGLSDTFGNLWTLKDGKIVGVRAYASVADARRAAGLEG